MVDFGVTDQGYVLPTQQQLIALMEADEKATISPNADMSSDAVLGQINGVVTRQLMIGYEGQQITYNSNDPDAVEGVLQTNLAKVTGTPRNSAEPGTVTLNCGLDAGTVLQAGVSLAAVLGQPLNLWTPKTDYTAVVSGVQPVDFESSQTGPLLAPAHTITVINTTIVGWNSVDNPLDAVPGTNVEEDPDLRVRREEELQGGGAGNVDALRAALLKINEPLGPFVLSAVMLNNVTDATDANGLPPHSTEAVIWDGAGAPVSNDAIAQVLWDKGSSGIRNFGSLSGTAIDKLGNPQVVNFTRVTQLPVYLSFALTPRAAYVGDAQFKISEANICGGVEDVNAPPTPVVFGNGIAVDSYDVVLNTSNLGAKVTGLDMSLAPIIGTPSAITATVLAVGPRQIAIFDSSRITVNGV